MANKSDLRILMDIDRKVRSIVEANRRSAAYLERFNRVLDRIEAEGAKKDEEATIPAPEAETLPTASALRQKRYRERLKEERERLREIAAASIASSERSSIASLPFLKRTYSQKAHAGRALRAAVKRGEVTVGVIRQTRGGKWKVEAERRI